MIQRVLGSKGLVAYVLACATGLTLYFRWPFPADDLMLHLIALRARQPSTWASNTPTPCSSSPRRTSHTRLSCPVFTSSPTGHLAS